MGCILNWPGVCVDFNAGSLGIAAAIAVVDIAAAAAVVGHFHAARADSGDIRLPRLNVEVQFAMRTSASILRAIAFWEAVP